MNRLLSHESPASVVAYRGGRAIEAQQFLADVRQLAERLPSGKHVLNVCVDRYRFSVGFAAGLMSDKVNLLPSTHAPEFVRQLAQFAPDAFCLTDAGTLRHRSAPLPLSSRSRRTQAGDAPRMLCGAVPRLIACRKFPQEQVAAIVFTSGSTGTPLPYQQDLGPARALRARRRSAARAARRPSTYPDRHGAGAAHVWPRIDRAAGSAERQCASPPNGRFIRPIFAPRSPAAPRPRALVSTPIHLRTLLAAGIDLPPLDLIVSATAPLSEELAREAETRFKRRLLEIYGSTETGQIATRRTADSDGLALVAGRAPAYRSWPGIRARRARRAIDADCAMCSRSPASDEFLLHGRTADLVNIAGKRSSFGYLNAQLNAIPGVIDGVFFLRSDADRDGGLTGVDAPGGRGGRSRP